MPLSPETVDMIITSIFEGINILAKLSKGEEITDQDLALESWDETKKRLEQDKKE